MNSSRKVGVHRHEKSFILHFWQNCSQKTLNFYPQILFVLFFSARDGHFFRFDLFVMTHSKFRHDREIYQWYQNKC